MPLERVLSLSYNLFSFLESSFNSIFLSRIKTTREEIFRANPFEVLGVIQQQQWKRVEVQSGFREVYGDFLLHPIPSLSRLVLPHPTDAPFTQYSRSKYAPLCLFSGKDARNANTTTYEYGSTSYSVKVCVVYLIN